MDKELQGHTGKKIQLRGFVSAAEQGYILATEPDLKSCCRAGPKVIAYFETDDALPLTRAITIEGIVSFKDGAPIPYLRDVHLIESMPLLWPIALTLIFLFCILFLWRRTHAKG